MVIVHSFLLQFTLKNIHLIKIPLYDIAKLYYGGKHLRLCNLRLTEGERASILVGAFLEIQYLIFLNKILLDERKLLFLNIRY